MARQMNQSTGKAEPVLHGKMGRGRTGVCALLFVLLTLSACSWRDEGFAATSFVGKWKSSRTEMPIQLYGNGEWEIHAQDGSVRQYGVWQLVGKDMLWSSLAGGSAIHDPNAVLSVSPQEFKVRERDGSTTTFVRID